MVKKRKRVFALALALCLISTLLPLSALADSITRTLQPESGLDYFYNGESRPGRGDNTLTVKPKYENDVVNMRQYQLEHIGQAAERYWAYCSDMGTPAQQTGGPNFDQNKLYTRINLETFLNNPKYDNWGIITGANRKNTAERLRAILLAANVLGDEAGRAALAQKAGVTGTLTDNQIIAAAQISIWKLANNQVFEANVAALSNADTSKLEAYFYSLKGVAYAAQVEVVSMQKIQNPSNATYDLVLNFRVSGEGVGDVQKDDIKEVKVTWKDASRSDSATLPLVDGEDQTYSTTLTGLSGKATVDLAMTLDGISTVYLFVPNRQDDTQTLLSVVNGQSKLQTRVEVDPPVAAALNVSKLWRNDSNLDFAAPIVQNFESEFVVYHDDKNVVDSEGKPMLNNVEADRFTIKGNATHSTQKIFEVGKNYRIEEQAINTGNGREVLPSPIIKYFTVERNTAGGEPTIKWTENDYQTPAYATNFVNTHTMPLGGFVVEKKVEGTRPTTAAEEDKAQNHDFTFVAVYDGQPLANTAFTLQTPKGTEAGGEAQYENKSITTGADGSFVLRDGQRAAFSGLEVGKDVKVSEPAEKNPARVDTYTLAAEQSCKIQAGTAQTLSFTNKYNTGSVSLSKSMLGAIAPEDMKTVAFVLKGADGYVQSRTASFTDGKWSYTFDNVPYGPYIITESGAQREGYTLAVTVDNENAMAITTDSWSVTGTLKSATAAHAFENTYSNKGHIELSKTVKQNAGAMVDSNKEYKITITGDKEWTDGVVPSDGAKGTVSQDKLSYTFTLKHGEMVRLREVPTVGYQYTVNEEGGELTDHSLNTAITVAQGKAAGQAATKFTLAKGDTAKVAVTNTYSRDTGKLTVSKSWAGSELGWDFFKNGLRISVTGPQGPDGKPYTASVILKSDAPHTFTGLPTGEYSIKEEIVGSYASLPEYQAKNTYRVNDTAEQAGMSVANVAVSKDAVPTVAFHNQYTRDVGEGKFSLHLAKEITGLAWQDFPEGIRFEILGPVAGWGDGLVTTDPNQAEMVKDQANPKLYTITLKEASASATLTGIPAGEYTVSEKRFLPKGFVVSTTLNGKANTIAKTETGIYDTEKQGTLDTVIAKPVKIWSGQTTQKLSFANAYSKRSTGDVTISKKLVGDSVLPDEKFAFEITFTFPAGQGTTAQQERDTYYEQLSAKLGWAKLASNQLVYKFTLTAGASATIEGLPSGVSYTVKETSASPNYITTYTITESSGGGSAIENNGTSVTGKVTRNVVIEFTNMRVYPLHITKELKTTDEQPITVKASLPIQLQFGDYPQVISFVVAANQSSGSPQQTYLPADSYAVTERSPMPDSTITATNGAEYSLVETKFPNGNLVTVGPNAPSGPVAVKVVNYYQRMTGQLTIAKQFTGDLAGDKGWDKFGTVSFTVVGPDDNWLAGKTPPEGVSFAPVAGNAKAYIITLSKAADKVALSDIPTGNYTVTEQPLTLTEAEKKLYKVQISYQEALDAAQQNMAAAAKAASTTVLVQAKAPKTITCYNEYTRLTGDLELSKEVVGPSDGSSFAIVVTFTGDKPGSFTANVSEGVQDQNASTYSYTANIKHEEVAKFTGIPTGTAYTVTEPNPSANYSASPTYSYSSAAGASVTTPGPIAEGTQKAVVTNTRNTGLVQVSKALAEGDPYEGSFAFTGSCTDAKVPFPSEYTLIDGASRTTQTTGQNGGFSLKAGQIAEFALYAGAEYQFAEAEHLYFYPEYTVGQAEAAPEARITVDTDGENTQQVVVTNKRKDLDAELKVTKKVDYEQVLEGSTLNKETFDFQIWKEGRKPFTESLDYTIDGTAYQAKGGRFTLKDGQTATFKLPAGVYFVEELYVNGNTADSTASIEHHILQISHLVNGGEELAGSQSGDYQLSKNSPMDITFVNRYIPKKTELTIVKDYAIVNGANPDFSFLLQKEVKQAAGETAWETVKVSAEAADAFTLQGGAKQVFKDLVPGNYRLVETNLPKIDSASLLYVAFDRDDDEEKAAKAAATDADEYVYEFTIAKGAREKIALTCTNMYQKDSGKILVTKAIAEGSYDSGDAFHFALLDAEGAPVVHSEITYRLHGTSCTWDPEKQLCSQIEGVCFDGIAIADEPNNTGKFALKAGERLVISGLDTGKGYHVEEILAGEAYALQNLSYAAYTLTAKTEEGKETWAATTPASEQPTVELRSLALDSVKDKMHHVNFTNLRQTGEIQVKKTVDGPVTVDLTYPIALRFTNEAGVAVADHTALGLTYTGGTPSEVNEAGIYVNLGHEQTITVSNIPAGLYCIVSEENTNTDGFAFSVDQDKNGTLITPKAAEENPPLVTVTNAVRLGSMKIQKSLQTPDAELENFPYEITVEFKNTQGTWTADPKENYFKTKGIEAVDTAYVDDNTVRMTFALKHGEQAEILEIPAGLSYVVTEAEYENNASRITNGEGITPWGVDNDKHNASCVSVIVYNYNLEAGDLVVSKEVRAYEKPGDRSIMFTQDFSFELRLSLADIPEDSEFMRDMLLGKETQLKELIAQLENKLKETPGLTEQQQQALDAYHEGLDALKNNVQIPEKVTCENCSEVATNSCSTCRGTGEVPAVCANASAGCELCAAGTAGLLQIDCADCLAVKAACETCEDTEGDLCDACASAQRECSACKGTGGSIEACACLSCDCGTCENGLTSTQCSVCAESELDTCAVCLGDKLVPNQAYLDAMQGLLDTFVAAVGDDSKPEDLEKQLTAIADMEKALENFKARLEEIKKGNYVNFNKETGEVLTVEAGKATPIDVSLLDLNAFLQDDASDKKTPLAYSLGEDLGVLHFTLKHGQAAIFLGLPVGVAYTVEELSPETVGPDRHEKTEASLNGGTVDGLLVEAKAEAGKAGNLIHFVNHYDLQPKGQVTVSKIWGANVAAADYVPVTITLYENGANPRTVTLSSAGWSHTFTDLDLGNKYVMMETALDGFAMSYSNPDGLELTYQNKSPSMSVTNSRNEVPPVNPPTPPSERPDRDPPPNRIPPEDPTVDITEPDVPLADAPPVALEEEILEELPEPEIPLGEAPKTGDDSRTTFSLVASILAFGLSLVLIFKRPEEKES